MIPIGPDTDWAVLLRDLLRMRRMSQADLCRATDYKPTQVSGWVRGVKPPGMATLGRLLPALGWRMVLEPDDDDAPSAPLSAPQGCETRPGVPESTPGRSEAAETRYASCGLPLDECPGDHGDHDDYPPLQETYPGSGIYE